METLGIFHRRTHMEARGACDSPYVEMGEHVLLARDAVAEGELLACASGRMRNARELAQALGLPPDAASQARIVLAAYMRWGEEYYKRVYGPVLTAVIDAGRDCMVLSRDRMGERRAFYAIDAGAVAFADHPDLLLEAGAARPVVDEEGLRELFGLGPARTPGKTPWRDMKALEPGCALLARGSHVCVRRYFGLAPEAHVHDAEQTVKNVREMLESAVDLIVPLAPACMLSGGIDSTALTALFRQRVDHVETFSIDYEGNDRHFRGTAFQPERDEPYIELAVKRLGATHHRVLLSQEELAQALEEAVDARGFPGMADVDSSLLLFAKRIAPHARFALSGECGDEVFGGYPWFRDARSLSAEAFAWSGSMDAREGVLKKDVREKLKLRAYVRDAVARAVSQVEHLPGESAQNKCLRTMQHMCFAYFMANLQERADCMCARAGVEVLTPFSDERLVQYVYNVPWEMKFLGGREKGLLRAAVGNLLPEALRYRKKSPYPKTCDPRYARIVSAMTQDMLSDKGSPLLELIDAQAVGTLAKGELSATDAPWFGQLMAGPQMLAYLWQVNAWLRARHAQIIL